MYMYVCIYIYIHTYTYIYIRIHCYKHRIKHRIRQNKPRVVLKPGRMPPTICTHLNGPYPPRSHEARAVHHDHTDEMSCHQGKITVLGQQHKVLREHLEIRSAAANHHRGMLTWGVGEVAPPRAVRSRPCTAATARLRGLAGRAHSRQRKKTPWEHTEIHGDAACNPRGKLAWRVGEFAPPRAAGSCPSRPPQAPPRRAPLSAVQEEGDMESRKAACWGEGAAAGWAQRVLARGRQAPAVLRLRTSQHVKNFVFSV